MYILTVTPNPSIDKIALVRGFHLGGIHRPEQLVAHAGGKGLNVARVIKTLGEDVHASLLLAGHNGRWITDELELQNLPYTATWSEGESRTCLSILDSANGMLTEIYEQGTPLEPSEWDTFLSDVRVAAKDACLITLSGSLPPGVSQEGYAELIDAVAAPAVPVIVDTHGAPLRHALEARPSIVKVNAEEAGELTGKQIQSEHEALAAAHEIRAAGVSVVIVTLGTRGAVLVGSSSAWYAIPPAVNAVSAVGSGDAFLGGFAVALARREPLRQALILGIAAGTANTLSLGAGGLELREVKALASEVRVHPM